MGDEAKDLGDAVVDRETKHSALPWRQHCFLVTSKHGDHVTHTGMGNLPPSRSTESEANAAFIVRAANNHYALIGALQACAAIFVKGLEATTDAEWDEAYGLVETALESAKRPISDRGTDGQAS